MSIKITESLIRDLAVSAAKHFGYTLHSRSSSTDLYSVSTRISQSDILYAKNTQILLLDSIIQQFEKYKHTIQCNLNPDEVIKVNVSLYTPFDRNEIEIRSIFEHSPPKKEQKFEYVKFY